MPAQKEIVERTKTPCLDCQKQSNNKVPGITAALCADVYSTERSIKSNNAKIMTMGAFTTGRELAKSLVGTWMEAQYTPGTPSEPKVQRIDDYDKKHSKKD